MNAPNKKSSTTSHIHPVVFPTSALVILGFVAWGIVDHQGLGSTFDSIQAGIVEHFSWLYVLSMSCFLVFAIYLAVSRHGKINLGREGEKPEFSTLSWFMMLFSAGMGIGLLFWSVAEPLYHYNNTSLLSGGDLQRSRNAMGLTIFHWGLHPWSLYALVGLSLAYFGFRRGLPLSFRSVFYPIVGERIHGRIGDAIDIVAVCATLFGVATSLGLGAIQVNAGLNQLIGLEQSVQTQIWLIAGITAVATISVIRGLHGGIKRLSEGNMILAALLMLFVFLLGPTNFLLNSFVENVGSYLQKLPKNSFWTGAFETESRKEWLSSWTIFYWGWWIAWSPFVGLFIARVSRGRTIREFITGVLLVPTGVSIAWLTVFGSSALHQDTESEQYESQSYDTLKTSSQELPLDSNGKMVGPGNNRLEYKNGEWMLSDTGQVVEFDREKQTLLTPQGEKIEPKSEQFQGTYAYENKELTIAEYMQHKVLNEQRNKVLPAQDTAMFVMLGQLPWFQVTAFVATLCVILFFVTSSDSASMVIDIISSGGNQNPPVATRIFWAISEGVVGATLLVVGGLNALQTASITAALPFSFIILLMCWSLSKGLAKEHNGTVPEAHYRYIKSHLKKNKNNKPRNKRGNYKPRKGKKDNGNPSDGASERPT